MGWQDAPEIAPPSNEKSGWQSAPEVGGMQPGEAQAVKDVALTAKERGMTPDELKTFLYSAGESGLFGAPTYAAAAASMKKGQSFTDALNEQRAYVESLQRQNPKSSMAGTGTGLVGGMFVPLGPLSTAGKLAARGAEAVGAGAKGKAIASGATVGAGVGALSGASEKFGTEDFTPEGIAKSAAFGAGTGAVLTPIAERLLSKKVSPEHAARVEILESQNVPVSREMVTGVKAPEGSARETADLMAKEAKDILAQKVEGMKTPDVSPNVAAEGLQAANRKAFEKAQEPYEAFKNIQGVIDFGGQTPHEYVLPIVQKSLIDAKVNPNFQSLPQNYPKANEALKMLNSQLELAGEKAVGQTLEEAMQVKRELGVLYDGAKGQDRKALQAVIDGYKNSVNQAVIDGLFTGDKLPAAVELFRSDSSWSKYAKEFGPGKGAESSLWSRIKKDISDDRGFVTNDLTPQKAQAAQALINSNIIHPRLGYALYSKLERTIGAGTPEMESFNALIRNNMLTAKNNEIANLPTQIQKYTAPTALPVTLKAFGASEGRLNTLAPHASDSPATAAAKEKLIDSQKMAQAIDIVSKSSAAEAEKQSAIMQLIKHYGPTLIGGALGLPSGATEAVLYGLAGTGASGIASGAAGAFGSAAQRAGAPKMVMPQTAGQPIPVGDFNVTPRLYPPAVMPPDQEPNYGLPQARATGGRVTTSGQLMAAMERAGKKDVQSTKPLLQSTDTAVAKALEIANQHI